MNAPGARIGLLGVVAAGAAAVAWAATVPITEEGRMDAVRAPAARAPMPRPDTADGLVAEARRRPLFRPARRPAAVGFDPAALGRGGVGRERPASHSEAQRSRSRASCGAPSRRRSSRAYRARRADRAGRGDASSGIRVKRIERSRVVLVGRDTSWVLEVREPWR